MASVSVTTAAAAVHVAAPPSAAEAAASAGANFAICGRLCGGERRYLEDGILQGVRLDGRGCLQHRPIAVETTVLPSANGSARVYNAENDILVGVKCEASRTPPNPSAPDEGDLRLLIDCSVSMGALIEGRQLEDVGRRLSEVIEELCLPTFAFDRRLLCVREGEFYWTVYIDIMVMSAGGGLLDIASLGVRAALRDTIIPKVEVIVPGEEDEDFESAAASGDVEAAVDGAWRRREGEAKVFCDDRESAGIMFPIDAIPICVSVGQIGGRFVWDMTTEEEGCAATLVTVAVDKKGSCVGVHTGGGAMLDMAALPTILQNSQQVGKEVLRRLDSVLDDAQRRRHSGLPSAAFQEV